MFQFNAACAGINFPMSGAFKCLLQFLIFS